MANYMQEMEMEYNKLLLKINGHIGQHIDTHAFDGLKQMCKTYLDPRQIKNSKTFLNICEHLEEQGHMKVQKYDVLRQLINSIDKRLLQYIDATETQIKEMKSSKQKHMASSGSTPERVKDITTPTTEMETIHNGLLRKISNFVSPDVDADKFQEFKFMSRVYLSPRKVKNATTVLEIFNEMTDAGVLSAGQYGVLKAIFEPVSAPVVQLIVTVETDIAAENDKEMQKKKRSSSKRKQGSSDEGETKSGGKKQKVDGTKSVKIENNI